ncbi:hypothetical protein [Furfurilactobacillus rossiae]|uniref:Uncharacterized protein n=1 Tax=Furfurilactobacillus rossiae DSM 15814 TaxID=1114972 RepID=A0A0R1R7M1_9LACO|nr:hypothetical protein [Furfurilactobacillus rossiae]KRL53055.1 hypothetical protein FD35_GL001488 [Furfurilactobacillus rossiae DSM 15814]MCF6166435.1 hypothetical protein [Furfurilactobacillus rossiae]QFR66402.1 hypothetical protein LR814_04545 [Furfurilactobacillus rossiae]QLE61857.1 hypothetical protein LROSRS0_1812 [Furfurilactobacillus rossiae]QLE64657.1 hypothetical protein LROSL1_1841 [Furfurilactobacillus rossiae]
MLKTMALKLVYQIPFGAGVFFFLWGLLAGLDALLLSPVHIQFAIHLGTIGWLLMVLGWALRAIHHLWRHSLNQQHQHLSGQL